MFDDLFSQAVDILLEQEATLPGITRRELAHWLEQTKANKLHLSVYFETPAPGQVTFRWEDAQHKGYKQVRAVHNPGDLAAVLKAQGIPMGAPEKGSPFAAQNLHKLGITSHTPPKPVASSPQLQTEPMPKPKKTKKVKK